MSISKKPVTVAFMLILAGMASCGLPNEATEVTDKEVPSNGENIAQQKLALTGNSKVCSVTVRTSWRDTIVVPDGWTSATCDSWREAIGGTAFALGCITPTGFVMAVNGGALPVGNPCGWTW